MPLLLSYQLEIHGLQLTVGRGVSVKLHLRDGRTDRQTPGIEFGASVTSGGNNFNEFPDN